MKKTVLAAVICAAVTFVSSLTAMAGTSNISVKNNTPQSKPVSYTYDDDKGIESVKSIKTLITKLEELDRQDSVVQTLTVTSESADGAPVSVKLRLSLPGMTNDSGPQSKPDTDYEILNYYNIKVTSADGTVLYDDADAAESSTDKGYKDIGLGTMNETSAAENKIFNITLSVNKNMKGSSKNETEARRIDWSIVTSAAEAQPTPAPDMNDTEESKDTVESGDEIKPSENESTPPPAQPTSSPTKSPIINSSSDDMTVPSGSYLIGREIPAGRYTMTGNGKVHIYGEDGILRMTIALKRKGDTSENGVDQYVLTIKDGETLSVENEIMLSPFSASVLSPTAKPSASPSPSPSPTAKSAAKTPSPTKSPAPTAKPAERKDSSQNPKTGDTTPVALISVIGAAALLSAAAIGVIKRKIRK